MANIFILQILSYSNFRKPYYFDNRIHNVGNVGLGGFIHANVAPFATKYIDHIRYNKNDIRQDIMIKYKKLYSKEFNKNPNILDLCCGVGMSTLVNQTGIDTSREMINKAKNIRDYKNFHLRNGRKIYTKFKIGNAEIYGNKNEFDCVSIMFAMHEMPNYAHINIINNCKRISKYNIIIVDISPNYEPSELMLSGEPYLINYLKNFNNLMEKEGFDYVELIDNHVRVWYY